MQTNVHYKLPDGRIGRLIKDNNGWKYFQFGDVVAKPMHLARSCLVQVASPPVTAPQMNTLTTPPNMNSSPSHSHTLPTAPIAQSKVSTQYSLPSNMPLAPLQHPAVNTLSNHSNQELSLVSISPLPTEVTCPTYLHHSASRQTLNVQHQGNTLSYKTEVSNPSDIRIMSFNLCQAGRVLKPSKLSNICQAIQIEKPNIIATQENLHEGSLVQICTKLNSTLPEKLWCYIISEETGDNYEKAAFLYKKDEVTLTKIEVLQSDRNYAMKRQPVLGSFTLKKNSLKTFQVMNLHLAASDTSIDIGRFLNGQYLKRFSSQVKIIVGDFNKNHANSSFNPLRSAGWKATINGFTNLLNDSEYDNIWVTNDVQATGHVHKLSVKTIKRDFSDHLPIVACIA